MRGLLDAQLARYSRATGMPRQSWSRPVSRPVDPQVDVAQLAALMNVTAVVMNTPDAYSLR